MKLRYAEKFLSIQGEARFVGVPSIFLRTFGCNFSCSGFGQPRGGPYLATDQMPYMLDPRADKNHPEAYKSISELPVTLVGCDSSASWAMKYKHLQHTETVDEVFEGILAILPNRSFTGKNNQDIHLVLTGGEPLLGWQKLWPELLSKCYSAGLRNLTFETNGTQVIIPELIEFFNECAEGQKIHVTWSTSPKLTISGEEKSEALRPEALLSMNKVKNSYLYNKFVVRDEIDFKEVDLFVKTYLDNKVKIDAVYCMPEGATEGQLALTEVDVAEECMRTGYKFSPRLHCQLFENRWGT